MYETPELGKLNGSDITSKGSLYQNEWAIVDHYLLGVVVGILLVAVFQIDASYPLSTPNEPVGE